LEASKPARSDRRFVVRRVRAARAASDNKPEIDVPPNGELGLVTKDLGHRLRAETALVARWDGAEQLVEVVSSWGSEADIDPLAVLQGRGFVGRVLASGRAAVEPIHEEGTRLTQIIGAPVQAPGGEAAVLCAGFSDTPPGDPDLNLWVVESYARLASLCLHDPGVLDGLFEESRRDGLTGCPNYASVKHELDREVGRAARHGLRLSCCFIDIDGFKDVNDRHGHLHGNRVLIEVASALASGMRGSDTLGRYGGDEFVAILPETGEAAACKLAERLRSKVGNATLHAVDDPLDASVGVAEWRFGSSAESVLEAADQALRAAKGAGGGVVLSATDLHTEIRGR
jgi:diguanylate cyclase (GGDEF)-like protein